MSLPITVSCFSKIQIGFTFLVPAHPGSRAIKRVYVCILTPVVNSQGMKKIMLCNTKKYKNQTRMNLTPPPSQNCHVVTWHCTTDKKRRIAEIKSWFLCRRPTDQQACDRVLKGRRDLTHWLDPMTPTATGWKMWWAGCFIYFKAHQHKAAGKKTTKLKWLQQQFILLPWRCGKKPHFLFAEPWKGVGKGNVVSLVSSVIVVIHLPCLIIIIIMYFAQNKKTKNQISLHQTSRWHSISGVSETAVVENDRMDFTELTSAAAKLYCSQFAIII